MTNRDLVSEHQEVAASRLWLRIGVCGTALLFAATARADLVKLKSGGELRGEIDRALGATKKPFVTVTTMTGAKVSVPQEEIDFVARRPLKVEQYETKARRIADTPEDHWDLAKWCLDQHLIPQREHHLQRVVELDPEHQEAHEALRHVLHNGEWLTRDEWMQSQGYVEYEGRWVTPQERDLLRESAAQSDREKQWLKKVRQWKGYLAVSDPAKRQEGLSGLRGITDPAAVPALEYFFSDEAHPALRQMYVAILGNTQGPRAVSALVRQSLYDVEPQIRSAALAKIPEQQNPIAAALYATELRDGLNITVRRAARALGVVGDEKVVPALIDALVTTHRYRIQVPQSGMSFGANGSGYGYNGTALPPDVEIALRTGAIPGVLINNPSDQLRPMKTVTVSYAHENPEVLQSLQKITGENFGYNERTWAAWLSAQKKGLVP